MDQRRSRQLYRAGVRLGAFGVVCWTLWIMLWMAGIWTSGDDPLSTRLLNTAFALFGIGILAGLGTIALLDEAKRHRE